MKDFLKRAGIYIIAGAVGFGAVNLIKNVYYSDRPEKAAKKVNKEFGNEIELAKEKASPDKLASEILKEKFSKLAEKKLRSNSEPIITTSILLLVIISNIKSKDFGSSTFGINKDLSVLYSAELSGEISAL